MKKKILLSPLLIIVLIAVFGVGVAGAAIYFGTTSGGETNTEGINLQKGLVGNWKFNGNAKDATANSNHGTVTGATLTTDRKGQLSKAYSFNGTSDYIDAGTGASLNITGDLTIALWLKKDGTGYPFFIAKDISGGNTQYQFYGRPDSNDQLLHFLSGTTVVDGTVNVGNNAWHHVVVTRSGTTISFYVDGALDVSRTLAAPASSATNLNIGRDSDTSHTYSNGTLDDVRIYNRALSATEITALYQEYDPGIVVSDLQKGLVGQWKLDGNAKDSTANSNHGTVTGATLTTDRKGQLNKAYSFDGDGDFVSVADNAVLNPGTGDFTYAFWSKANQSDWINILSKANGDYSDLSAGWVITIRSDIVGDLLYYTHTDFNNKVSWNMAQFFEDNLWHHWVFVGDRSAGTVELFKDGVSQGAQSPGGSFSTANITTTSNLSIGCSSNCAVQGRELNGLLDDVRIYNRALSATEVTALYQEYNPSVQISDLQKGLVGHWKLDGNAKDSTANSKHGTVTGTTLAADRKGQLNKAYSFDGLDDYIVAGNIGIPQNGPATLSGWFYLTQDAISKTDHNYLWGAHAPGTGADAILYQHSVNNKLYTSDNDYFNVVPSLNQWLHIVLTYSGNASTAKLYINNVSYGITVQGDYDNITALSDFRISSYYSTANFAWSGYIDDVRVYNRVLSQAEITALYESY